MAFLFKILAPRAGFLVIADFLQSFANHYFGVERFILSECPAKASIAISDFRIPNMIAAMECLVDSPAASMGISFGSGIF